MTHKLAQVSTVPLSPTLISADPTAPRNLTYSLVRRGQGLRYKTIYNMLKYANVSVNLSSRLSINRKNKKIVNNRIYINRLL